MKPQTINQSQAEIFRNRLSNQIKPNHPLKTLADQISWSVVEEEYAELFDSGIKGGRPAAPVRLVVGLLLLQYLHDLSDEAVCESWVENPYWQYFCGYDFLQWELPLDPSSLSRWRGRLGKEKLEQILKLTVKAGLDTKTIAKKDMEEVTVDTTVMPKHIAFPTDSRLLNKSRERLVKLAKKKGVPLRQNYNQVTKKLSWQISGYLHAKQMKRAAAAIKKMKTITGRVVRDIERKISGNEELQFVFKDELEKAHRLLNQTKTSKNKLYSLHEPDVECIAKGKARVRYEFGCKAGFIMTNKKGKDFILGASSFHGNPYDGHTLQESIAQAEAMTETKIKAVFVDRGYKGHDLNTNPEEEDKAVWFSRQKHGVTKSIRKKIARRQAIEPHLGHMKTEGKLGRCRLWGKAGDDAHAILVAAGYNMRLILNHLKELLLPIFWILFLSEITSTA
jgi:IS5 family transposase